MRIGIGFLVYDGFGGLNNLGDWYQTAAAMYIWWKFLKSPVTFYTFLQDCIRTRRIGDYPIVWLERNSMSKTPPVDCDKVVTICNAWWICKVNGAFDFPLPSFVEPLFTGVHIGYDDMVTPDTVVYLNSKGPIGCRDLSTMSLLQTRGVSCYFSGCITSLLDLRDPSLGFTPRLDYSDTDVYVDVPSDYRTATSYLVQLTQNGKFHMDPRHVMESIQRNYELLFAKSVRTHRLHVWLPLFANGGRVTLWHPQTRMEFKAEDQDPTFPKNDRFKGIVSLREDPVGFATMKQRLLEDVTTRIDRALRA